MKRVTIILSLMVAIFGQAGQSSESDSDSKEDYRSFFDALFAYVKSGNCTSNALAFSAFAKNFPNNEYARDALEISTQLSVLNQQRQAWKEPSDWRTLPPDEQIDYHIYHLQNMDFVQDSWPDECNVVKYSNWTTNLTYRPALELTKIGLPAVPKLIQLLNDRRPTRCVGFRRPWFTDSWTLLRYQDAAIQILEAITDQEFYRRLYSSAYLSRETDEYRSNIIRRLQQWHRHITGTEILDPPYATFPDVNPTVLNLLSASQRQLSFEYIVFWQKYFHGPNHYTERSLAPVGHVVVCPQPNGKPPMFAVFQGPKGKTEGMFSFMTAQGEFVNVFNGYNILQPPGTILDVNGDGIFELLTNVSCAASTNNISTSLFIVIPVMTSLEPLLAVAYNRGDASDATFQLSTNLINGSYDIDIRKRESGTWRTLATYTWSSEDKIYEGPKGSSDSDVWMFRRDPGDAINQYTGPGKSSTSPTHQ